MVSFVDIWEEIDCIKQLQHESSCPKPIFVKKQAQIIPIYELGAYI